MTMTFMKSDKDTISQKGVIWSWPFFSHLCVILSCNRPKKRDKFWSKYILERVGFWEIMIRISGKKAWWQWIWNIWDSESDNKMSTPCVSSAKIDAALEPWYVKNIKERNTHFSNRQEQLDVADPKIQLWCLGSARRRRGRARSPPSPSSAHGAT